MRTGRHVITLGGLGSDAHWVGLTVLRHALADEGYRVNYLGIQNPLQTFFMNVAVSDVVMMSCMDGHARNYLRRFAELSRRFPADGSLWYIGGNLSVHDADALLSHLTPLGFSRAFPQYVDIPTVLATLAADLAIRPPRLGAFLPVERRRPPAVHQVPPDDRMEPDVFDRQRAEVLEHWETGWQARQLDDNAQFLSRQPSFALAQSRASPDRTPLLHPRSGVALVDDQIAAFTVLRAAGADVLSYQIDSLTRTNAYADARAAIAESRDRGTSTLNGFPMVNHGVDELRRIAGTVRMPLQTRHSTRDPRLLAEISAAGGVTGFEGSAICYNIPYYKDYPLAESLARWQYVDRLAGLYFERNGIVIDREFFGTLTAVLVPPSLAIVSNLIGVVLAATQGVRAVSVGYAEQGNRAQDIAAIRVMRALTARILTHTGHPDVQVNTVFHQYMAAFPAEPDRARKLIVASAATARSLTRGVTEAFVRGYLDVPFSPSQENRGEVLTARDADGAVRYVDTGRLQFSAGVRDFHRSKMEARRQALGAAPQGPWALVERDVAQRPLGPGQRWPLDG